MNSLVAPALTTVDELPLGKRISEIMKEKGTAYSQNALSQRLGLHKETFRKMLIGERSIYTFELTAICEALKMSQDRILQKDIKLDHYKFRTALSDKRYSDALVLAEKLLEIAVGFTERCRSLNDIGRVYYYIGEFEKAHEHWLNAYSYADQAIRASGKSEPLFNVTANLMIFFS